MPIRAYQRNRHGKPRNGGLYARAFRAPRHARGNIREPIFEH